MHYRLVPNTADSHGPAKARLSRVPGVATTRVRGHFRDRHNAAPLDTPATLTATMQRRRCLTCKRSLVRVQCRPPNTLPEHEVTAITAVRLFSPGACSTGGFALVRVQ